MRLCVGDVGDSGSPGLFRLECLVLCECVGGGGDVFLRFAVGDGDVVVFALGAKCCVDVCLCMCVLVGACLCLVLLLVIRLLDCVAWCGLFHSVSLCFGIGKGRFFMGVVVFTHVSVVVFQCSTLTVPDDRFCSLHA